MWIFSALPFQHSCWPLPFTGPAEDENSSLTPLPRQCQHCGSTGAEAEALSRLGPVRPHKSGFPPGSSRTFLLMLRLTCGVEISKRSREKSRSQQLSWFFCPGLACIHSIPGVLGRPTWHHSLEQWWIPVYR